MPDWFSSLLEKSNAFIPHGHCYLWIPSLLWLHVISDTLIGIAYVGISLILYLLVRKIRLPFSPVFIAFGLFIGLCGLTHFMNIWTVWNPDYWLAGIVKAATAAASVATAIGLFYIRPQVEEMVHAARLSEERRIQLESTNAELQALYRKLKEADELKTQFFANVSHELRTPLALILGPAERLVEDTNLTAEQVRQLESISRNGKTLLKQVNDLLDVAKLEEGQVSIQYLKMDLVPWFRQIAAQFEVSAEHRDVRFHVSTPDALSADVDPDMLERVLINLLSNAFKFTPAGGSVHAELAAHKGELELTVTDTGPGINERQREVIFERFRQADGGATRAHGGTGLGLAIAKDFVGLHGGQITVTAGPEGGSIFTVRLPRTAPAGTEVKDTARTLAPATQAALEGVLQELQQNITETGAVPFSDTSDQPCVLVVEDTAEMRALVASILGREYQVVTAEDGEEGLERAEALRPDLIVTDIMMPRMSGDQLVGELRQRPEFDKIPILLLTAKADDDLRVQLLKSGAQDYLTKPFLPQELLARASNLVAMKRTGDALRTELASASNDLEVLAQELAIKHRQLQAALDVAEVAREQAERASEVKSHFLAMISHEMRTPLSTIQMNAQLLSRLLENQWSESSQTQLERLLRAAQQLSTLIEGLLEYTRIESGRIATRPETLDAVPLADKLVEELADLQAQSPDIRLEFQSPAEKVLLQTDPRLLRVVLSNLLTNALKFTNQGTVTLRVANAEDHCLFEVQDTGVGIPEEDLPRIFTPFEQLEPLQRKSIPGVGLGLAVTKEIVESLSGQLHVKSKKGMGSTFTVLLPRQQPVALAQADTSGKSQHDV